MLRMSWRPGRGVLVIEGVVDRDHRDVLALRVPQRSAPVTSCSSI